MHTRRAWRQLYQLGLQHLHGLPRDAELAPRLVDLEEEPQRLREAGQPFAGQAYENAALYASNLTRLNQDFGTSFTNFSLRKILDRPALLRMSCECYDTLVDQSAALA